MSNSLRPNDGASTPGEDRVGIDAESNGGFDWPPGPSIHVDDPSPIEETDEAVARVLKRYESLSDSLCSLENEHEELSADHADLRKYINEEFTHVRTILENLIEETKGNGASIDQLRARREQLAAERERLIELKEATIRLGIETATCESCGTDIDLGTLASPTCPRCSSTFSDLKQDAKWFGLITSNTITTADTPDDPDDGEPGT